MSNVLGAELFILKGGTKDRENDIRCDYFVVVVVDVVIVVVHISRGNNRHRNAM